MVRCRGAQFVVVDARIVEISRKLRKMYKLKSLVREAIDILMHKFELILKLIFPVFGGAGGKIKSPFARRCFFAPAGRLLSVRFTGMKKCENRACVTKNNLTIIE